MSKKDVKAFYERLGKDETFKAHIEGAESKQKYSQIIREAGYDFTQEEFEEFTAQLLNSNAAEDSSDELNEKTLEAVLGGIKLPDVVQLYGSVPPEV